MVSPISPVDDSDAATLLAPDAPEPAPGLHGNPADRTEPYTRIEPFQERQDTSLEFFYKPVTLTALAVALALYRGAYAAVLGFLVFSMIQFRDGPFIRPHPAFWRIVLGLNLLYELALVYAENCSVSPQNIWVNNAIDIFCLAHALGWFGKAMILRDYWFCWHQLPNFEEWVLDVLICNWLGTYAGMKACQYFEVKHYTWRGFRQSRGIRSKTKRVFTQFSPHDFTAFHWHGTASLLHYVTVVMLLAVFLVAELNPFYLKSLLWMEPDHPFVIVRLAGVFLCALPAVRELYQYINDPRVASHCQMEYGQFPAPLPTHIRVAWTIGAALLVLYPISQFGVPSARGYLQRYSRKPRAKAQ
ncbi:phosphatidyl serine synthase-domain-containing protein [Lactifluus volemus]|nr:phosphatidyl serine synthase-domain-containing protein [Lactifluus volemus]